MSTETNKKSSNQDVPQLSPKLFQAVQDKIINPVLAGTHVTVVAFKKAGIPFAIHATTRQLVSKGTLSSNTLFIWISLETEQTPADLMFSVLLDIKRNHHASLQPHVLEILNVILAKSSVTEGEFRAFLDFLVYDEKFRLVFILKDVDTLLIPNRDGSDNRSNSFNFVEALTLHCTQYSGFIFISSTQLELPVELLDKPFFGLYKSNILLGTSFMFDDESLEISAKEFQKQHTIKFTPAFIEKLKFYSHGDPTVVLYSFYQALFDSKFVENVKNALEEDAYSLFGESYLDWRFGLITSKLSTSELTALKNKTPNATLLNMGLLQKKSSQISYLNPLFTHFVEKRLKMVTHQKPTESTSQVFELKGQELLLFELLQKHQGDIISKEKIAEAIWGPTWEQKYSDWALDKLISTLKKKLISHNKPYKIQTFKKLGVMLVPDEHPALELHSNPVNSENA